MAGDSTPPDLHDSSATSVQDDPPAAAAATVATAVSEEPTKTNGDHVKANNVPGGSETKVEPAPAAEAKASEAEEQVPSGHEAQTTHKPETKRRDGRKTDRKDRGSNRAVGSYVNRANKSRFDEQPESNDADEIRRQVEFYFSDSNLPIDQHLLTKTGGSENNPVHLKEIHDFRRMRHFQPFSAVCDAVRGSRFLNLDEKNMITRRVPLDDRFTLDASKNRALVHTTSMSRSIYAKGFGDETATTHLDIEAFFQPYGPLRSVRLRRTDNGAFKGSVFVEFADDDIQRAFLALDPKPKWDNDTDELKIMSKKDYVDEKHNGIVEGVVKPRSPGRRPNQKFDRRAGKFDRNGRRTDSDDWKTRRDRDQESERNRGRGRGRGRGRKGRGSYKDRRRDDSDSERERDGSATPPSDADKSAVKDNKKRTRDDDAEADKSAQREVKKVKDGNADAVDQADVSLKV